MLFPMVASGAVAELRSDASRRQLMRRAATVGLLMRNSVVLLVAVVTLLDPASPSLPPGEWMMLIAALWSAYRLGTRSHRPIQLALDCVLVLAVCVAIPVLTPDPHFYLTNSAPQAIAGTAVISFAVSVPVRVSLPITAAIAACYAWGSIGVTGWANVSSVPALYYFALQWLTSALIRLMVLRVAAAVDQARAGRRAAELDQQVADAVWQYDREQLALLHDTAASTLLLVGQGAVSSRQRLSSQAQRDLAVLQRGPWVTPPERLELVRGLRDCARFLQTPVEFGGLEKSWLVGDVGQLVLAAGREVMNNVDRHAKAGVLRVTVTSETVLFVDDGVGFDPDAPRSGRGVTDSIVDRMCRAGGRATITSSPGAGTSTELSWAQALSAETLARVVDDPDRLIDRVRVKYGLALVVYALANLAFAVPQSALTGGGRVIDAVFGVAAATSVLTGVPGILRGHWRPAWIAASVLTVVTILQPLLLPPELVGGYAHWAQSAVGWCVLPLVLGLPTRRGAAIVVLYWLIGVSAELLCLPYQSLFVNIGLGTASILGVQLFALLFNGLVRVAADQAHAETERHHRLVAEEQVSRAVRDEYQRRYARLVNNVLPLLHELSGTGGVGKDLQSAARAQSRRLRALFDQEATFNHPLMRQIRRLVDVAESHDLDVVVDVDGALPTLEPGEIACLVAPLNRIVTAENVSVRLVVTGTDTEVSVSAVCDGVAAGSRLADELGADGGVEVVTSGSLVWVETRRFLQTAAAV